ncbi:MAG: hypothetical protein AAB442_01480 [Patescibacteria group bacterium]
MNNPSNSNQKIERRLLPYFVEFVKFASGFAAIIAVALLTLHIASAAMP